MSPVPAAGRRLPALLLAAAALVSPLALGGTAHADEPGGDTVVGELVRAWPEEAPAGEDVAEGHADEPLTWVRTDAGDTVPLRTGDVPDLPVGATVAVTLGGDDDAAAGEARPVVDGAVVAAAEVAAPTPANAVTVVRVVPAGGTADGTPLSALTSAVDGVVGPFFAGQTGGLVRFGVAAAVPGWVQATVGCEDPARLWDEAAAAAGFVPGPGRHLLVYLAAPDSSGCPVALGQVGTGPGAGGSVYVRSTLPALIAHELGHNLGLGHSSAHQCDGAVETGSCRTAGYRDYYDVMGASWEHLGSLNAAQAASLGVLPASARRTLAVGDAAATVALAPLSGTAGTRAVRLTTPDGSDYWLEYRAATGQDAWLAGAPNRFGLDAGVLLHRAGAAPDTALLLDGTPGPAAGWDADLQTALPPGVPVPVGGGSFTVTVQAVTDAEATLVVLPAARPVAVPPVPSAGGRAPAVLPGGRGTGGTTAGSGADAAAAPADASAAASRPAPVAVPGTAAGAVDPAPALAPLSRSTSTTWLLPLLAGLLVTGTVLAAWRGVVRLRTARR
ncbi:reprolysin-like metallopeptidase [Blastococcus sp. SYSU D00695]